MKVEIIGNVYSNHSLAINTRYLAIELSKYVDVYLTPLDSFSYDNQIGHKQLEILKELQGKKSIEDPDIQLRYSYPPIWRWPLSNKTKVVFMQPWEYYKVPLEWQLKWEHFADAIITHSKWTETRYLEAGVNPNKSFVVPCGYNPSIFNKKGRIPISDRKFTYTYVGCAQYRKGIDILLNAWLDGLVKADNVRLIIKDNPSIYGENSLLQEILKMQYKTNCAEIIYIDDKLSETEMANLYKETDVIVHPYRGEGFGMMIQEAMACGALPLVTRGGAADQFVNDDNSILLEVNQKLVDVTDPNIMAGKPGDSFTGMHQSCRMDEPVKEDLSNKIKGIYFSHVREEILNKTKTNTLTTWKQAGKLLHKILKRINSTETVQRIK